MPAEAKCNDKLLHKPHGGGCFHRRQTVCCRDTPCCKIVFGLINFLLYRHVWTIAVYSWHAYVKIRMWNVSANTTLDDISPATASLCFSHFSVSLSKLLLLRWQLWSAEKKEVELQSKRGEKLEQIKALRMFGLWNQNISTNHNGWPEELGASPELQSHRQWCNESHLTWRICLLHSSESIYTSFVCSK